eukprot:jgi/Mesvir1/20443/Mv12338-RA.2
MGRQARTYVSKAPGQEPHGVLADMELEQTLARPMDRIKFAWKATYADIAAHCGADACEYLVLQRATFVTLAITCLPTLLLLLPLNLYAGHDNKEVMKGGDSDFVVTTVSHFEIPRESGLLWVHTVVTLVIAGIIHGMFVSLDRSAKKHMRGAALTQVSQSGSITAFTILIRGVPRELADRPYPLWDYLSCMYPGKIFKLYTPMDRSKDYVVATKRASALTAFKRAEWQLDRTSHDAVASADSLSQAGGLYRAWWFVLSGWYWIKILRWRVAKDRAATALRKSEAAVAAMAVKPHRGAGIAFVVFKDALTASRAVKDLQRPRFHDPRLQTRRWVVAKAPAPSHIIWSHVGVSTHEEYVRSALVNVGVFLVLLFWSSPVAMVSSANGAFNRLDPAIRENLSSWLTVAESNWESLWFTALLFHFLPNIFIYVTLIIVIPALLFWCTRFERHLTISGRDSSVFKKNVCFFIVNLFLLKVMLETSVDSFVARLGQCYYEDQCENFQSLLGSTLVANSSESLMAFLLTASLIGVSFDLLSLPYWLEDAIHLLRGMRPSASKSRSDDGRPPMPKYIHLESSGSSHGHAQATGVNRGSLWASAVAAVDANPRQEAVSQRQFDFPHSHAFNLTVFTMTLSYATLAPVFLIPGTIYFGARYLVDKYNLLFVFPPQGPAFASGGKVMPTVLRTMRVAQVLYLFITGAYLYWRGGTSFYQALVVFGLMGLASVRYLLERLCHPPPGGSGTLANVAALELGSVEEVLQGQEPGYDFPEEVYQMTPMSGSVLNSHNNTSSHSNNSSNPNHNTGSSVGNSTMGSSMLNKSLSSSSSMLNNKVGSSALARSMSGNMGHSNPSNSSNSSVAIGIPPVNTVGPIGPLSPRASAGPVSPRVKTPRISPPPASPRVARPASPRVG